MAIKEMKPGVLPEGVEEDVPWSELYDEIFHIQSTDSIAYEMGMEGFTSLGIRRSEESGVKVVVLKTCESALAFSKNDSEGDNYREAGWFVAMDKEEALGLAKKLIELAGKLD